VLLYQLWLFYFQDKIAPLIFGEEMMEGNSKRKMLFVGGLDDKVNEEVLHAAFIPFGTIKEVHIPRDFKKSKFCWL